RDDGDDEHDDHRAAGDEQHDRPGVRRGPSDGAGVAFGDVDDGEARGGSHDRRPDRLGDGLELVVVPHLRREHEHPLEHGRDAVERRPPGARQGEEDERRDGVHGPSPGAQRAADAQLAVGDRDARAAEVHRKRDPAQHERAAETDEGEAEARPGRDEERQHEQRRKPHQAREQASVERGPRGMELPRLAGGGVGHASSRWRAESIRYTSALRRMPATSSSLSSRRTLAGTPATSDRGGMAVPSSTSAPAATSDSRPTTARLRTVAFMPMRQSSSIVQPCTTAPWPTETPEPIVTGTPSSTCTTTLSCRFEPAPSTIVSLSARSTAP